MARSPLSLRSLSRAPEVAVAVARRSPLHGIYVHNALAAGQGTGFVFDTAPGAVAAGSETAGLCWIGPRGNLVVIAEPPIDVATLADAITDRIQLSRVPWRIAMGPAPVLAALRRRMVAPPLVDRDQVYYAGDAAECNRELRCGDARLAVQGDRERLLQATLQLNHSDLQIEPRRVDRRWLYDSIDERIANGTTWVSGPAGAIECKLDIGSAGPAGIVIEGVFTFPSARGRGCAAALVAACLAAQSGPVALHVAADNEPAQHAYARAGMTEGARCRLLLLG